MSSTQQALNNTRLATLAGIRTQACPNCFLCGSGGERIYHGLRDRLFTAPGSWNLKKCRNKSCGLLWLDPMPLAEDIGKAYETYYTHAHEDKDFARESLSRRLIQRIRTGYLARSYGYFPDSSSSTFKLLGVLAYLNPFRRASLDFSVMHLPFRPHSRLLEIGCGTGGMLKIMQDLGWLVEGIDFDPIAVESCRRKCLDVRLGALEDQVYPADSFDAITMSHLIEHVPDPQALLEKCFRLLKPNGYLSVVTPHSEALGHRLFGASWFHLDPPRHLNLFAVTSLKRVAENAGFSRVKVVTTIRDACETLIASRSIQRTRRFKMGSPHSRIDFARGKLLQILEWVFLTLGFAVGEELALTARKPEASR
jgi:2-polyprenyl-3-methyl-5-hydroxy-6-metoxy-1,4-benzoquinol methylase